MAKLADLWTEWREGGGGLPFALVDAAGYDNGLRDLPAKLFSEMRCLFTGELAGELEDVAPYLGHVASWEADTVAGLEDLLRKHLGVLVLLQPEAKDEVDFAALQRHFRKFNVVYGPEGQPLFFRYYDPRALADVLPVMEPAQLAALFGPVATFVFHDRQGQLVRCRLRDGALHTAT